MDARKPRPLVRDKDSWRDDRLFIIACDDTYAPKQYFGFFKFNRVKVHVIPTVDGTSNAQSVLNRLLEIEHEAYDERWIILDTDHNINGPHLKNFTAAIAEAKRQKVSVAMSRPCFEVWLLLHHGEIDEVAGLKDANETAKALKEKLGSYNKTSLKEEHFPLDKAHAAYGRAVALDKSVNQGDIPDKNTTRVFRLWEEIIKNSLPSSVPHEVRKKMRKST